MDAAEDGAIFDYILIGGGTAACVLANRLTSSGRHRVLMLEAGARGQSPWVRVPAGFTRLLTHPRHNWLLRTEPEAGTGNRAIAIPKGKGLGGSTLINGMIYVRGQPRDFDGWAQAGCTGWDWDDVRPYFDRVEDFDGAGPGRGKGGALPVTTVAERPELAEAFLDAAAAAGLPRNPDYNGETQDGAGYYQVNQRRGRRVSAADAYLRPAAGRGNLAVLTDATVQRVTFIERRASGVVVRLGGETRRFRARGEVIVAAGAVHSPQILELSGLGDPERLREVGIEARVDLPGVGENYADHYCTRMNWRVTRPVTLNEASRGLRLVAAGLDYGLRRRGMLTLGTGLAYGFLRTRPGLEGPDVQLFFMHASYANAAERRLDRAPGMTLGVTQLRPSSRGSIHLTSREVDDPPAIRPNFLATEEDRRCMIEGMKMTRRIVAQAPLDRYRGPEISPGADCESDADWLAFARFNGQTIYHAAGTCRMGRGPGAVVDPALRVHGIEGLRVVDASVMPAIVSGNTQAAVYMIAEKAADLILAAAP